jgi:hypothetical protein
VAKTVKMTGFEKGFMTIFPWALAGTFLWLMANGAKAGVKSPATSSGSCSGSSSSGTCMGGNDFGTTSSCSGSSSSCGWG